MSGSTIFLDSDATIDVALTNGFFPPVSDGCVGYYELGGTLARSLTNLVNPALGATVTGTPTVEPDGVTFTPLQHFFDLGYSSTDAFTFLVAGKQVSPIANAPGGTAMWLTNFRSSGTANGDSIYTGYSSTAGYTASPAGFLRGGATYDNAGVVSTRTVAVTDADLMSWFCGAVKVAPGDFVSCHDLTKGVSANSGATVAVRNRTGQGNLRLGSSYDSGFLAQTKIVRAAVYNRALSLSELAAMRTFWTSDLAPLGIAV
jgi:hypothetical protein